MDYSLVAEQYGLGASDWYLYLTAHRKFPLSCIRNLVVIYQITTITIMSKIVILTIHLSHVVLCVNNLDFFAVIMAFFVRTKLKNIFRSILFSQSEIQLIGDNCEKFIDLIIEKGELKSLQSELGPEICIPSFSIALIAHNAQSDEIISIDLVDEYGTPIDETNVLMVHQFKHSSHFYIEICAKFRHTDVNNLVEVSFLRLCHMSFFSSFIAGILILLHISISFQSIKNYLKANDGEFIFKEQEILGLLKPKTKNKFIEKLVFYIFENYTMYPKVNDIILVSNAVVHIFDKLKDDQGGIVSLIQNIIKQIIFKLLSCREIWFLSTL